MLLEISRPGSLYGQVYDAIRNKIVRGELTKGSRLPSSRTMARELCVSRNVILAAYDNLLAEGYLESRHGSGTFVAVSPDVFLKAGDKDTRVEPRKPNPIVLSEFGKRISLISQDLGLDIGQKLGSIQYNFRWGIPAVDLLPKQWQKIVRKHASRGPNGEMGYGNPQGNISLREQLAKHVLSYRGIQCDPDDILIVNGSQQGIDLAARMIVDKGDAVAVEDPCYPGIRHTFQSVGAKLLPIAVDRQGMRIDDLATISSSVRMICVTPSYQYPTGSVMSQERRLQLLDYARAENAVILEDDYDSEFRFDSRPERALFGSDPSERTIYVGTFSKQLFPALRIGYLILPRSLKKAFLTAKVVADRHAPTMPQEIVSEFMAGGHLAKHLRRVRAEIVDRRTATIGTLKKLFGTSVEICGGDAGTHLLVTFKELRASALPRIIARARTLGVEVYPAASCYATPPEDACLVMGYASLTPEAIAEGLRRLAIVIGDCFREAKDTAEPVRLDVLAEMTRAIKDAAIN